MARLEVGRGGSQSGGSTDTQVNDYVEVPIRTTNPLRELAG